MFQFTGFPSKRYGLAFGYMGGAHVGCPIQISAAHNGYLPLAAAFRSLSRLSSALSAKASALCSFCLTIGRFRFRVTSVLVFSFPVPLPSVARARENFVTFVSRMSIFDNICPYGIWPTYHLGYLIFVIRFSRYESFLWNLILWVTPQWA